jgi:hypothetical protein
MLIGWGTAPQGRALNSLGFQPQAGWRIELDRTAMPG